MKKQSGFSVVIVLIIIVIVGAVGFVGYRVMSKEDSAKNSDKVAQKTDNTQNSSQQANKSDEKSCSTNPVVALPVESARITSILYPGQVRGGNFKPHGGFILNGTNEASVTLPLEAKVVDGVRYNEMGEVQYMFDFDAGCGIRFRLDHLNTLSAEMQALADKLPQPTEDSRTTKLDGQTMKAGTIVATKVGFVKTKNTSFDFGLYDMNAQNAASKEASWPKDFQYQNDNAKHAVCWFDYLSDKDETLVRSLPAGDGQQGKTSKYCK